LQANSVTHVCRSDRFLIDNYLSQSCWVTQELHSQNYEWGWVTSVV